MFKDKNVDPLKVKIESTTTEIKTLNNEVKEFWDKLGDAEPPREELKRIGDLNRKIEELEHTVKEANEDLYAYGSKDAAVKRDRLPYGRREIEQMLSAGEAFANSEQIKKWVAEHAPNGRLPGGGRVPNSPAVDLKTLITGASSTSAGAFVVNERLPIVDQGTFYKPLTIRDIVTNGKTSSDTVEYVRQGTHTNNAAVVAEATATSGSTGSKPESAMVLAVITEAVKNIAHWVPTSRRAIADAAQISSLINSFLLYGLEEKLAGQIVTGDGVGENFTGLFNTSGVTAQAYDTSLLTTARKGRTKVYTTGRATPNAFLMNPNDWQAFDLLVDGEQRYHFGGPAVIGNPKLWGLPVVESEHVTEGTAMVADFKLAMLWDREQASILMSDSHSDFFTRNLIAILAEARMAFGVLRPAAFVTLDLTA